MCEYCDVNNFELNPLAGVLGELAGPVFDDTGAIHLGQGQLIVRKGADPDWAISVKEFDYETRVHIDFCPMCGRALTTEELEYLPEPEESGWGGRNDFRIEVI